MKKASFFQRSMAVLIDYILFGLVGIIHLDAGFKGGMLEAISVLYETLLVSQWNGYTIGKRIMGIKVVSRSGGPVSLRSAFIRAIGKILSWICLLVGYFWMLWDKDSQTWHDKLAETYVVQG